MSETGICPDSARSPRSWNARPLSSDQSSQGPLGFATDGRGDFWIKLGAPVATPVHIAFVARDRAVDAFHEAAVRVGGADNGSPALRRHYGAGYYAAYALDPTATTSRPSSTPSPDVRYEVEPVRDPGT
jgi:hypothetical protein